ncbi:MAG TPA: hypothetical protein VHA12_02035 [Candidatus Nanoarchaeia archaeon]|nr:hypothetical protein [Candidatus Nanoarchaeia archaeon]
MIRFIFIVSLLLLGQFFFIVSKEKIDFSSSLDKDKLFALYVSWFGHSYDQFFDITGQVIKRDWFSYNNTNLSHS